MQIRVVLIVLLLGVLVGMPVQAGTIYNTQAAFLAALPPGMSTAVETFDGLGALLPPALAFPGFGADCVFCADFRGITSGTDTWLSTDNNTGWISFNFATPVTAAGGFFFITGTSGQAVPGVFSVEFIAGGETTILLGQFNADSTTFLGYIPDSVGITGLIVRGLDLPGTFATANDLTFAAVPEPSSAVLLGIGMLLLVGFRTKAFN